jgi:hypothetical protein
MEMQQLIIAAFSTTNPIWIDPGANPGPRSERPASNRLNHGMAIISKLSAQLPCLSHHAEFLYFSLIIITRFVSKLRQIIP